MQAGEAQISLKVFLWVFGVGLAPLLCWCVTVTYMLLAERRDSIRLIHMHENADKYGFGTVGLTNMLKDFTIAIRGLTYYVRWAAEKQAGEKPPPFIDTGD